MPVSPIAIIFALLLLTAAVTDFLYQRIPNWLVILVAALFAIQAARHAHDISWINQFTAAAACLVVGLIFFALGQMGAGDAKLLTAIALWCGLGALLPMLFLISVSGLVVVAILLGVRRLLAWQAVPSQRLPMSLQMGQGVPFGVAIAVGTLITMRLFPHWLWVV